MSSHHRQPVVYVASAPSRSYQPTSHHGRSRSGSHASSSHSYPEPYYTSGHRRASTSSHGRPATVVYVRNTRSHEEPRYRSNTTHYYTPSSSHGSHGYDRDRDHRRRSSRDYAHHDSGHHGRGSREYFIKDAGRHERRRERRHEEEEHEHVRAFATRLAFFLTAQQYSVGDRVRLLLGMKPHNGMMYDV